MQAISGYPGAAQQQLHELRELALDTASSIPEVKRIEECLKWGQPSFVVHPKGVGSTVRLGADEERVSVYFICNTTLVEDFRAQYPDTFQYRGNREIYLPLNKPVPVEPLSHCMAMAFTYHLNKKKTA